MEQKFFGLSEAEENKTPFNDESDMADYAKGSVYSLKAAGYDSMFSPKHFCTRAEAAVMIYNVISYAL